MMDEIEECFLCKRCHAIFLLSDSKHYITYNYESGIALCEIECPMCKNIIKEVVVINEK